MLVITLTVILPPFGLAGLDVADATTLIARRGTPRCRCHPRADNAPSAQISLDLLVTTAGRSWLSEK